MPLNDFTATELHIVEQTLNERFGTSLSIQEADAEVRLSPNDRELSQRPVLYWEAPEDNSKFLIIKIANDVYKCQFFYRGYQQFSTNSEEYDNIGDCVVDLLQVHSEHEAPKSVLDK